MVRLVRDAMGEDIYHAGNIAFRDAGRRLAPARDSQVLIETLDHLCEHYTGVLAADAFAVIRRQLQNRHTATLSSISDKKVVDQVLAALSPAEETITGWRITATDFTAFDAGLHRVYRRGRKAMKAARAAPTAEKFHEWRKRVKYLRYHMRILPAAWPNVRGEMADALHDLANLLGDDHDPAVLHDALCDQAWPLSQRLYAEWPADFTERIAAYWDAWVGA